MRTKTLLLTAAFAAASVATSMAQVYSVNAVGYVNISIPIHPTASATFALISNPLNGTNNLLSTILPAPPEGTSVYLFRGGSFEIRGYSFGAWDGESTINHGEGFFVGLDPAAPNPTVLTFVGEVPQGTLNNPIPVGFSLRASIVPQAGALQGNLGLVPSEGDTVYKFNVATQGYTISGYSFGDWDNGDPQIAVGESFWYLNANTEFMN
jgi:hypothetical protein